MIKERKKKKSHYIIIQVFFFRPMTVISHFSKTVEKLSVPQESAVA